MSPRQLSVVAQALYLSNLLLLPGLSFLALLYFFKVYRHSFGLGKVHLVRALQLSMVNGIFLGLLPITYIIWSEAGSVAIMLSLFYFICVHAAFVLLAMLNLTRAMVGKLPFF